MLKKFKSTIIIFLLLVFSLPPLLAQESVTVISKDLSEGVTLELNTSTLIPSSNFIAIHDSSNNMLALSKIVLDDQKIWIKKSNKAVDKMNKANWSYDEDSQFLYIDLSGLKESFSPNTVLQLTILRVKTVQSNLAFAVFRSSSDSGNTPGELRKISDVKVDLK